jgi:hypothetical protein
MTTANAYRIVLLTSLLTLGAAGPASATPVAYLHWDDCHAWQLSKVFTGPDIYSQVITGQGFASPVRGHELTLRVTAANLFNYPNIPLPEAWRFDPAGCQAGRLDVTPSGTNQPCPPLASTGATETTGFQYDGLDLYVTIRFTYDLVTPSVSTTYLLAQMDYDHLFSGPGPQNPPYCGFVDDQVCFTLVDGAWLTRSAPHLINTHIGWPGSRPC